MAETMTGISQRLTIAPTSRSFIFEGDDGRVLLIVSSDGTVTGAVEDASEAGRKFVQYVREQFSAAERAASLSEQARAERFTVIEAAVKAILPNVENMTAAWNVWNNLASDDDFRRAIVMVDGGRAASPNPEPSDVQVFGAIVENADLMPREVDADMLTAVCDRLNEADVDYSAREQRANAGDATAEPGDWFMFLARAILAEFRVTPRDSWSSAPATAPDWAKTPNHEDGSRG